MSDPSAEAMEVVYDIAMLEGDDWRTNAGSIVDSYKDAAVKAALADLAAERDRLLVDIRDMIGSAGNPDAAQGCRNIIAIGKAALKRKEPSND